MGDVRIFLSEGTVFENFQKYFLRQLRKMQLKNMS